MTTKMAGLARSIEVRETVDGLATSKGISFSGYVRQIFVSDLDNHSVFTTKLKTLQDSAVVSVTERS